MDWPGTSRPTACRLDPEPSVPGTKWLTAARLREQHPAWSANRKIYQYRYRGLATATEEMSARSTRCARASISMMRKRDNFIPAQKAEDAFPGPGHDTKADADRTSDGPNPFVRATVDSVR